EEFDRLHLILKDKGNPEYKETAEFARLSNYKIRYPKSAINRQLKRIFSRQHALTEFNDEEPKLADKYDEGLFVFFCLYIIIGVKKVTENEKVFNIHRIISDSIHIELAHQSCHSRTA